MKDHYLPNYSNPAVMRAIRQCHAITRASGIRTTYRPAVKMKRRELERIVKNG